MANKITIKFEAQGARALKSAIDQLTVAQTRLNQGNKEAERLQKKLNRELEKYGNSASPLAIRNSRLLSNSFATLRSKLLLAAFAYATLDRTIGSTIKSFAEQELSEKKLETALGRTSKGLLAQASALQRVTSFGDETIISAQALIAAFIDDEEQIKAATEATLDLAAAKGMDLNSAADLVSKTLGSSTNSLSRYGIEVEGAVGSSTRLNSLTESIAKTFGGQAKEQTNTLSGAMSQLSNIVGDLAENIGEKFSPIVSNLVNNLSRLLTSQTPVIDSIIEERKEFNNLISVLNDVNVSESARSRIIGELNDKYGQYINGLISESDGLDLINKKAEEANRLLRARVIIQSRVNRIAQIDEQILATEDQIDALHKEKVAYEELFGTVTTNIFGQKEVVDLNQRETNTIKNKELQIKILEEELANLIKKEKELLEVRRLDEDSSEEIVERYQDFQQVLSSVASTTKELNNEIKTQTEIFENNDEFIQNSLKISLERAKIDKDRIVTFDELDKATDKAIKKEERLEEALLRSGAAAMMSAKQYDNAAQAIMGSMAKELEFRIQLAIADAMASVFKRVPYPMNFVLAAGAGAAAGSLLNAVMPKFEEGGMVGGNRHSQGGTIIEAERGEFVMSRDAVESIGVNNLEAMNAGGGGASVVINNPIISSEFVESELPELISEAVRKGVDFGMS
jgi:hypothetical protein